MRVTKCRHAGIIRGCILAKVKCNKYGNMIKIKNIHPKSLAVTSL